MFSFSRVLTKISEKASPTARNKNWLTYAIVNKQKWRDLKEFKKTSEEIPKIAIQNQANEEEEREIEINQENNLPKEETSQLKRFSVRNDSGYGELTSNLEIGLVVTNNSVSKEFESLQKQKESNFCLDITKITKFELGNFFFNQSRLNLQLNEERKKNIKLKNQLETTEKKLSDLRQEYEKIWEYVKLQEKLAVIENDNYLILKLFLNSAISERDNRPNITVQKWEEFWKKITNLTNNIQVDLTKAKNAIADDVENFSVIANNYWESVQNKITDLKNSFWCSTDEKNTQHEEEINIIDKNYINMHQTRLREENLPAGIDELRKEVIGQIKKKLGKKGDDLLSFEVTKTDYENEINQFSENEQVIEKGREIFTLISTFEGLIEVNNFLKAGNFDLINEMTENSQEDNEESVLENYRWENKDWSRWVFLKENLKIGVDANKPSPLFLEEDNSSSLSSPFSVSPRPSSESDLSEIENVQSFEGQCTEIVDDFRKSSFPARKLKEENELLWLENESFKKQVEVLKEQIEDLEKKSNRERRIIDRTNADNSLLVREKEDLFTEGESRIEELNNRIARSQEKIAELEEENENQRLEDKETIEIIKGENKILTRELEKKRKEKLQHEKEISDLNHNIVELNQAIVEISAYNEAEINGLKGLCEELEEKLEEERGIIETIGKVLWDKGIELSSLGGKTPNLGEELNKVKDELNGKIGKMKNRASSLDSLNSLKDKISNLSNNSSRNSSYSHSLRKKSEGKKRISITQGPFVVSPICIDSSEGQGSSYFEPQNNQNLTIDSNSISDNQEISENFNNISYDDYEALKKEKDKLKKELMITKGQLHKANLERDECRNQEVKSEEINSLRTEQLNNTKKKIKELKEEIRKIKENSRVFANQQIIEESPILNIDNINQNLEKREELEAVIETIIVRN